MSGSFSIALSGLTADTDALDIVGNNLANLNTTGYKDTTASFYDLLAQSAGGGAIQIGGGVSATIGQSQFTQGSIQLTGGTFDAAIQGNGFFVVKDSAGDKLYTRAGNFQLDGNGNSSNRHRARRARLDVDQWRSEHQRRSGEHYAFPPMRYLPPSPPHSSP